MKQFNFIDLNESGVHQNQKLKPPQDQGQGL